MISRGSTQGFVLMNRRFGWSLVAVWVLCAPPVSAAEGRTPQPPLVIGSEAVIKQSGRHGQHADRWLGPAEVRFQRPGSEQTVRIGVLAKRGRQKCLQKWGLTADYLGSRIPGYAFKIVPLDFEEIYPTAEREQVEFILANSSFYVGLERLHGANRLVTLRNVRLDNAYTVLGGVIFRKADRNDIQRLDDLVGKTFMAVEETSFGGWQMAWRELKQQGIDPWHDFSDLRFGGTHDAVVHAVLGGEVDAGTVRTDTLERMAQEGKINLDDVWVINQHGADDGFPFHHSTRLYPEWPLAELRHTSDELAEQVVAVLMNMPPDCPAAKAARCAGWTIPRNYQAVHECLKELRVMPYQDYGKVTAWEVLRQYWPWLLAALAAVALLGAMFLYTRRLNAKLRDSHKFLQTVIDAIPDTMMVVGSDYRIALANRATRKLSGEKDPVTDRLKCYQVLRNSGAPCEGLTSPCPLERTVATKAPVCVEHIHCDPQGNEVFVEVSSAPVFDKTGEVVRIVESCRDITERKQAEEALESNERKLRTITDSALDAVIMIDSAGNVAYWNPAAEAIFGYSSEEILGQGVHAILTPLQYREAASQGFLRFALSGQGAAIGKTLELTALRKDGTEFPIEISVNAIGQGGSWWAVAVLRDITERKQAEREIQEYAAALESNNLVLEQLYEAAEAANRAKSEFLANMSHEIRTPMTAILGFTDILLDDLKEPKALDAAQTVKRNGEHLLKIINDVLDISKIEADRFELEEVPWPPREIVAEVISLLHVRAAPKGLTLTDEYLGPQPETITTDPVRLRQVLVNLVGNAVKFTETGGVRIVTRLLDDAEGETKLRFDVIDTGIGIPEEQIEGLFEPFVQADGSTTRDFGGTGLGLAISRRFARLMGGDVTAKSEPGKGSTFSLTVAAGPLEGVRLVEYLTERVPVGEQPDQPTPETRETLQCRILLAEDIVDNQRLSTSVLRDAGADVTVVDNGQEALEKVLAASPGQDGRHGDSDEPFDVILMDMQMPILDGYAATRRLRQEGYTGPIIGVTTHAMRGDRQKCLDAGCDDYLRKPIDQKKMVETVAKWVSRRQQQSEPAVANEFGADQANA